MSEAIFSMMWGQRAEAGDPIAQFNLGYCYEMGQGTTVDQEAAVKWYLKAAEQGYPRAQYHVGLAYSYGGQGVEWNLTEACKWLTLASWNGIKEAEQLLRQTAFPPENRIRGEQAAKAFEPRREEQKPVPRETDTAPAQATMPATQLGLGL